MLSLKSSLKYSYTVYGRSTREPHIAVVLTLSYHSGYLGAEKQQDVTNYNALHIKNFSYTKGGRVFVEEHHVQLD